MIVEEVTKMIEEEFDLIRLQNESIKLTDPSIIAINLSSYTHFINSLVYTITMSASIVCGRPIDWI